MARIWSLMLMATLLSGPGGASADDMVSVELASNDVGTLHVDATLGARVNTEFLLDTGSAYVVLTDATRRRLADEGALTPVRELRAVMANNATARAQVYRVSALRLASGCVVRDFEAVALPGARKDILGLSALRAVAPFTVHLEPLHLEMHCTAVEPSDIVAALDLPAGH